MPLLTLLMASANQDSAQQRGVHGPGPPTCASYMKNCALGINKQLTTRVPQQLCVNVHFESTRTKRRLVCFGRTTNLFSRCKRNNVSTCHQYACWNIKHGACSNKRGLHWCLLRCALFRVGETKRVGSDVSIKYPATSYYFYSIFSSSKLPTLQKKKNNKCTK